MRRRARARAGRGPRSRPAERVISRDPDARYTATAENMGEEAFADFRRAIHDPGTVHAMCEDYRAGSGSTASTTTPTVCGATIDSGHHMAEEAPDELASVLREFLSARASA